MVSSPCSRPGTGRGLLEVGCSTSLSGRTSGGPYSVHTIAFMGFLQVWFDAAPRGTRGCAKFGYIMLLTNSSLCLPLPFRPVLSGSEAKADGLNPFTISHT